MTGEPVQDLQGTFLIHVGKTRTPLTVFLVSGVKLQGVVTWFDSFSTLLKRGAESQLVYKHANSTIMSLESIQLSEHGDEPEPAPRSQSDHT